MKYFLRATYKDLDTDRVTEECLKIECGDVELIEEEYKKVLDRFNCEEHRRAKKYPDYPLPPDRVFNSILGVSPDMSRHTTYTKLVLFYQGLPLFKCDVSGHIEKAILWPSSVRIENHFCRTCNEFFAESKEYNDHRESEAHLFCVNSDEDYPFFSSTYAGLMEDEEYRLREIPS